MLVVGALLMTCTAGIGSALYRYGQVDWRISCLVALSGCLPLYHTVFDWSEDISAMVNEIHRWELQMSRLQDTLKECERQLKNMEERGKSARMEQR